MVGLPYDCLANPLGAVRLTFDKAVASSGSDPTNFNGRDWGATDIFRDFLFDNGGLSQVPILNATNLQWIQSDTLVRFRGMIQDMLGNEFYVGAYKDGATWRTNKFTDVSQFPMHSSADTRIWERRLLYCVPVPGQNSWTESSSEVVLNPYVNWISPTREKRQRENNASTDDVDDDVDMQVSDHEIQDSPCTKKMREGGPASLSSHLEESTTEGTCPTTSMVFDFDRNSFPCLVKVYDSLEADLKLNDVFEFVGVLTFDLEPSVDKDDSDEFTSTLCEDELSHSPPSKVPRLYCLVHRKLAVHDFLSSSPIMEVEYDFKYYKMEMEADVQLLILSEGKSNILPADLVLPFCPLSVESCEIGDAEAQSLPHSIEPDMQKRRRRG